MKLNLLQSFKKFKTSLFPTLTISLTALLLFISGNSFSQCNIFYDDFESGSFTPTWSVGTSLTSTNVTTSNTIQGTYNLTGSGGNNTHLNGFNTSFTASTPSEVSWYMYTTGNSQSLSYTVMGNATMSATDCVFFNYWRGSTSEIRFVSSTSLSVPAIPNTWYFIELRNINWSTKTFDIYVNGALESTGFPFRSNAQNSISQIHLYNFNNGTGYWDQITVGALNDSQAPVPDQANLADVTNQCEVTSLSAPTATDNCDGSVTGTHNASFPITSNTTVTWTYIDVSGNSSTQNQNIVINDVTAPVADNASLADVTDECEVTSLTAPTATDNCDGLITGTHNATLPISSSTTVTWTYIDVSGNSSTQNQNIVINDVTVPVADNASLADVTDECEVTSLTAPTATDNCDGTITGTNNASFPITANTTVTWTYEDTNGNSTTQDQQVNITGINNSVTVTEPSLTADNSNTGVSYQWITCAGAIINGATSQTYTPDVNGDFAVIITEGNCTDTSNCATITTVGLTEYSSNDFSLYPNPTNGLFTVESDFEGSEYHILDAQGRLVQNGILTSNKTQIILKNAESGVYYLRINQTTKKIILE